MRNERDDMSPIIRYEKEDTSATAKLSYLIIGGGIGAILALLFAPKSGSELRGDIADVTRKGLDKTKEAAGQLQERAGEYYEVTREKAGELYSTAQEKASQLGEKAKDVASRSRNPLSDALEAGKEAYTEEKRRTQNTAITEGRPTYPVEDRNLGLSDETGMKNTDKID